MSILTRVEALSAAISGVAGLIAFPPKNYAYWWKWTPRAAIVGIPVLFLTNGAVGLASYALGRVLHWHPPGGTLPAAIQYALAGQALLRTEVRGYDLDQADAAFTLLGGAGRFIVGGMDALAASDVKTWVRLLGDSEVVLKVYEMLEEEIARDPRIVPAVLDQLRANIDVARGEMNDALSYDKGRGTLNGACIRMIKERRLTA